MRALLVDNYDSFTHMLADYVKQCGVSCTVVRNHEECLIQDPFIQTFDCVILSPGPETPAKAGYLMQLIHRYHQTKPMLGICLGHQALGEYFGATLGKAIKPMHGKVDRINVLQTHPILNGIPNQFNVTRYHSLVLTNINSPLKLLAESGQKEAMMLAHEHLPLVGIQFHPESCVTENGLLLVKNFMTFIQQRLT